MDLNYLRRLVKLVTDSGIDELEIEQDNARVRITRSVAPATPAVMQYAFPQAQQMQAPAPAAAPASDAPAPAAAPKPVEDSSHIKVLSPIVGTFYRASTPEADPFVQVGSLVTHGTTLCIIEAMKIMNEIESEFTGRVVRILVENGAPVEYNQPLFLIDPA
jgi:acetyl-CoA carboxylase biotin carboxyl carrier protein